MRLKRLSFSCLNIRRVFFPENWPSKWAGIASIVGAIAAVLATAATVVAAVYAAGTYRETSLQLAEAVKQTRIYHDQLAVSERTTRPYVILQIEGDEITAKPPESSGSPPQMVRSANLKIVNFGSTPAVIKSFEAQISLKPSYDGYVTRDSHTTGLILAQAKEYSYPVSRPLFGDKERFEIGRLQNPVYIIGRVLYTDVSGQSYETSFCLKTDSNVSYPNGASGMHLVEAAECSNSRR